MVARKHKAVRRRKQLHAWTGKRIWILRRNFG